MRAQLLQVHWLMFKEHPFFGIGYWESYRQIADYWPKMGLPSNYIETHSHNQYLNVLATTGVFGFCFFIAIMFFILRKSFQLVRCTSPNTLFNAFSVAFFVTLIQFYLACLTDVSFEYAKVRGIWLLAAAGCLSLAKRNAHTQ